LISKAKKPKRTVKNWINKGPRTERKGKRKGVLVSGRTWSTTIRADGRHILEK